MSNNTTKIIVKVGKKSKVKFSHSQSFRALLAEDLGRLAQKYNDCHIVVIESITKEEENTVREFVNDFKAKDKDNEVFFFIPDENDDITSGLADELDYNIYMTLKDLYKDIRVKFNVNLSTYLADKREVGTAVEEDIPEALVDYSDGLDTDSEDDIAKAIKDVEENNITVSFDDTESLTDTNTDESDTTKSDEVASDDWFGTPDIEENANVTEDEAPVKESKTVKINKEALDSPVETTNSEVSNISKPEIDGIDEIGADEELDSDQLNTVEKLKLEINDLKYDYSVAIKDMKDATLRIAELEGIINAVEDEKNAVVNRFNELLESDTVIEDPISLAEYEGLKSKLQTYEDKIKELESAIASYKETVSENNATIEEKESALSEVKARLSEVNDSIESGAIHKDIIEEYNGKIEDMQAEKDKLNTSLSGLAESNSDLANEIKNITAKLDMEIDYRQETVKIIQSAFVKLKEVSNKLSVSKAEVAKLTVEKNSLSDEKLRLEKELADSIKTATDQLAQMKLLKDKVDTADTRIELANNFSNTQIESLKDNVAELEAKLKMTEEQLTQKENQYLLLVQQSGMDSAGANTLMQTNSTLEKVNKSLREQVSTLGKELDTLKRKKIESDAKINMLESSLKQVSEASNSLMAAGVAGGVGSIDVNMMKPIRYNGVAQIIPVFGSGSFGITTAAMSIAYKLCTTSKVLYIDFDMVAPKADAWFSKMPICKNIPGIQANDSRATGLGLFYEKGFATFNQYIDNIIIKCDRTKGGAIDYLSGIYYRVDNVKVITADYTNLLNLLGNRYNYIVIDMGRLGNSDVNDRIIKNISDVATRNVVVTTPDKFETRNFRLKLTENKIDINRIAWLVNMCTATTLEDRVKQAISPALYGIILDDPSIHGMREKFTRNKLNKDKLDLFVNSILFR